MDKKFLNQYRAIVARIEAVTGACNTDTFPEFESGEYFTVSTKLGPIQILPQGLGRVFFNSEGYQRLKVRGTELAASAHLERSESGEWRVMKDTTFYVRKPDGTFSSVTATKLQTEAVLAELCRVAGEWFAANPERVQAAERREISNELHRALNKVSGLQEQMQAAGNDLARLIELASKL
jgi:hypothetical protein